MSGLPNLPRMSHASQTHLNVLKIVIKVLYDDKISFEIIKYIINLQGFPAEEEKMANDLNLKFDNVRQSLTRMGNDGILISREFKRKKEKEDDYDYSNPGRNVYQKNMNKKASTLEWEINDTYFNIIRQRFEDLKVLYKNAIKYKSTDKFVCPKCKEVYELDKVAHVGYICKRCDDRPKLNEVKAEDVSQLDLYSNEILQMLGEEFNRAEKTGTGFHYIPKQVKPAQTLKEKKTVNNLTGLQVPLDGSLIERKGDGQAFTNLMSEIMVPEVIEDPEVEEKLKQIKSDEKKLKRFQDLMELYLYK